MPSHLSDSEVLEQTKERRERVKALREAWPHRHGLRGRIVVGVNVRRLKALRDA